MPGGQGKEKCNFFVDFNYLHIHIMSIPMEDKDPVNSQRNEAVIKYNHLSNVFFRTNLHS